MLRWLFGPQSARTGRAGERKAAALLKKQGYRIVERNWRSPMGEVDIIAVEDGCLVFIEVKTRSSPAFGDPSEAVGPDKRRKIIQSALWYANRHRMADTPIRFDIVSVYRAGRKYHVEILRNAFEAQ